MMQVEHVQPLKFCPAVLCLSSQNTRINEKMLRYAFIVHPQKRTLKICSYPLHMAPKVPRLFPIHAEKLCFGRTRLFDETLHLSKSNMSLLGSQHLSSYVLSLGSSDQSCRSPIFVERNEIWILSYSEKATILQWVPPCPAYI